MDMFSAHRLLKLSALCVLLFSSVQLYAEDFASFFFRQVDPKKKISMGVVYTDSLGLSASETTVDVNVYLPNKNRLEKDVYKKEQNGKWNLRQRMVATRMEPLEKSFFDFLKEFSYNRDIQISKTIFPLPVSYKGKDGIVQKKLIMPRDWEDLKIWQNCPSFRSVLPMRQGNNRKVLIYQGGKIKEYYNFIYINKVWYLIEMEVYI